MTKEEYETFKNTLEAYNNFINLHGITNAPDSPIPVEKIKNIWVQTIYPILKNTINENTPYMFMNNLTNILNTNTAWMDGSKILALENLIYTSGLLNPTIPQHNIQEILDAHKKHLGYITRNGEKANSTMDRYKKEYNTIRKQSKNLPDNIASGALQHGFNLLADEHKKSLKYWTIYFTLGLVALVAVSAGAYFHTGRYPHLKIWEHALYTTPFTIPIIWFLLMASKRINGHRALYEDYRHKAALSMAYTGFSKNIENPESNMHLLKIMVDAYSKNPTDYLQHIKPDSPISHLFGELTIKHIRKKGNNLEIVFQKENTTNQTTLEEEERTR